MSSGERFPVPGAHVTPLIPQLRRYVGTGTGNSLRRCGDFWRRPRPDTSIGGSELVDCVQFLRYPTVSQLCEPESSMEMDFPAPNRDNFSLKTPLVQLKCSHRSFVVVGSFVMDEKIKNAGLQDPETNHFIGIKNELFEAASFYKRTITGL